MSSIRFPRLAAVLGALPVLGAQLRNTTVDPAEQDYWVGATPLTFAGLFRLRAAEDGDSVLLPPPAPAGVVMVRPLRSPGPGPNWRARWPAGFALLVALAGCATPRPALVQVGQAEAEVLAAMGPPTGRYPLADGAQRLEFAQGPFGVRTWMVDLDAAGKVLMIRQVMDSHYFNQVQDGMSRDALLRLLGRPAARQGEWQNRETWSWRYENYDCLWVRVTLTADGTVWGGASTLPDPQCDSSD